MWGKTKCWMTKVIRGTGTLKKKIGQAASQQLLWDLQEKKMCRVESLATRNFLDLAWYERILP